jgi:hypothetical protein
MTPEEDQRILATFRSTRSWTATGRIHHWNRDTVKEAVKRASKAQRMIERHRDPGQDWCRTCIDADRITFTDDGHAWCVFDAAMNPDHACPDCIEGRHTFEIEVATGCTPTCPHHACRPRSYRVSVVPGMVLPIVLGMCPNKTNDPHRPAHIHMNADESPMPVFGMCVENADQVWDSPWKSRNLIDLPPNAAPGMWAVRLAVHNEEGQ